MPKVLCDPSPEAQAKMLKWMASRIPGIPIDYWLNNHPLCFAVVDDRSVLGVVCFHDYRTDPSTGEGLMVEMSGAADTARWLSRGVLGFLFSYAFNQLGVRRMNTVTPRRNVRALKVDQKLGFQVEGMIREALPDGDDLMILGMLRRECKWIGGQDGQEGIVQRAGNA